MSSNPESAEEQPQANDQNEKNKAQQPQSAKKKDKPFTYKEVKALRHYRMRYEDQISKGDARNQDNAWIEIRNKVNEAGQNGRTVQQCVNKWNNDRSKLKKKVRKTKDLSQLEDILEGRDMKLVKILKLDREIGKDVGRDSTDDLNLEDDPDSRSTSFNDSFKDLPPSPLVTSTPTPNPDVPVTSDDTIHSTTIDEPEQQSPNLETKLDQLLEQQRCTNRLLTNISKSVDLQLEILELLKNIMSTQKKASDGGVYEVTLKRKDVEQRVGENQLEEGNE